ncbi:MAG TPA: hypothetical protein VHZ27_02495, partial [Solirubrobacteraceae bacterium]|nr:hypothetical protein [Solirubrobacteraceae bacterium]
RPPSGPGVAVARAARPGVAVARGEARVAVAREAAGGGGARRGGRGRRSRVGTLLSRCTGNQGA